MTGNLPYRAVDVPVAVTRRRARTRLGFALLLPLGLLPGVCLAASGGYTPPAPLDSVDALMGQPADNGYGLGALIASQQADRRQSGDSARASSAGGAEPRTAVAREARRAATARREAKALSAQVAQLQADKAGQGKRLADLQAQVSALTGQLTAAQAQVKAAADSVIAQLRQQLADKEAARTQLDGVAGSLRERVLGMLSKEKETAQQLTTATAALQARERELMLQGKAMTALKTQLALSGGREKQLADNQAALAAGEKRQVALKGQVDDLTAQLATARGAVTGLQGQLASAQTEVATLKARPVGPVAALDSSAGKQAYVVGQSIASSLRERLDSYAATGVSLSRDGVLAGISDGLAGSMQLPRAEMDSAYRQFATRLQTQVADKVKAAEQQLAAAVKGQKVTKSVDGMRYVVVKKGKAIADPDAPVSLALTEQVADGGRVVSQVPRLTLSPADDMPPVVREALPLLGVGAEVKAWALARSVYGNLPLPKGVEPYTVLRYDMKGLAVGTVPAAPASAAGKGRPAGPASR